MNNSIYTLCSLYQEVPEQRIGQFLSNIMRAYKIAKHQDPFYATDEDFLQFAQELTANTNKKQQKNDAIETAP